MNLLRNFKTEELEQRLLEVNDAINNKHTRLYAFLEEIELIKNELCRRKFIKKWEKEGYEKEESPQDTCKGAIDI